MWPAKYSVSIRTLRADALFVSALQRSDEPSVTRSAGHHRGCPGVRPRKVRRTCSAGVRRSFRNGGDPDALGARRDP